MPERMESVPSFTLDSHLLDLSSQTRRRHPRSRAGATGSLRLAARSSPPEQRVPLGAGRIVLSQAKPVRELRCVSLLTERDSHVSRPGPSPWTLGLTRF